MFEEMNSPAFRDYKVSPYRVKEQGTQVRAKRILIIDDNLDLRLSLADILVSEGYKVATAKNGQEGLSYLFHKELPDLILLDLAMPILDGYEFLEKQNLNKDFAKVPVIVISGEIDQERILELTHNAFCLEKPLDYLRFLDVVEQLAKMVPTFTPTRENLKL